MLESRLHEASYFCTLTYDKEHLPCDMSVSIRDVQLFLKRFRELVSPVKVRYFIVGEYGDVSLRPHYHAVLFGLPAVLGVKETLEKAWKMGHVHLGVLTEASASYVVSYTTKGMTGAADVRLKGRRPEFARMSLKPGIGAGAMEEFAHGLRTKAGRKFMSETGDVVSRYRSDGQHWPLGRYLRRQLRKGLGLAEGQPIEVAKSAAMDKLVELASKEVFAEREEKRRAVNSRAKVLYRISSLRKKL